MPKWTRVPPVSGWYFVVPDRSVGPIQARIGLDLLDPAMRGQPMAHMVEVGEFGFEPLFFRYWWINDRNYPRTATFTVHEVPGWWFGPFAPTSPWPTRLTEMPEGPPKL